MNTIVIQAFVDEMTKLAELKLANTITSVADSAKKPFLVRNAKPIAHMAMGAGLYSMGQDIVNDYRTGRMVRKQNEAQQSMY